MEKIMRMFVHQGSMLVLLSIMTFGCGGGGGGGDTPPAGPPVISGTPATTAIVGMAYSFVPTASDPNTGAVLTFSIANKPAWASFNSSTGALTGTPSASDVGTTSNIVISVNDGTNAASLPAFNLTVAVNLAIGGSPETTATVGVAYSFVPTASDLNAGAVFTFSITNKPAWASFNSGTGALTGTPVASNVGTTTGIVISVSDGTNSASLPAFTLTVSASVPVISGSPATTAIVGTAYNFVPSVTDTNTGAVFTFSITNKPAWASFNSSTGALAGTPSASDVGTTTGIVISVSNGTNAASLQAFNLTVMNPTGSTGGTL